jgi:hypothetical protein
VAFPTVQGTPAETAVSTAGSSHAINLPASIVAGELLLIVTAKGTPAITNAGFNTLAGWTEIVDEIVSLGITIWARTATGSEGATVTMTSDQNIRSASIAYRIAGAQPVATQAPELSTVATGSSTSPNATTCTPTGGARDYLWISLFNRSGEEADDDTWCSAAPSTPSAFSNLVQKACGTAGTNLAGMIACAQLASNAASLDAGAFTCDTGAWRAYTIAIHPIPVKTATAAVTIGNVEFSGTAVVHAIGTSALTTGNVEFAATATFALATGPWTATANLLTGNVEFAATATMAYHPVARITQPTFGIFGQRYGSFSGKQVTATSDLTIGGVEFAGTATAAGPTFTATASLTTGGTDFAAGGTTSDPVFSATAGLTTGNVEFSASAASTDPVFSATADLLIGGIDFAGSAAFSLAVRTATGALTVGGTDFSGSATHTGPAFTATAALTLGGIEFAGQSSSETAAVGCDYSLPGRRLQYTVGTGVVS